MGWDMKGVKPRPWTADEDCLLYDGRTAKPRVKMRDIAERLGRTTDSCTSRWQWLQAPDGLRQRKREAENLRRRRMGIPPRRRQMHRSDAAEDRAPPQGSLIDRHFREIAPRSLTAIICGDPPPGWSALDRRQHEAAA